MIQHYIPEWINHRPTYWLADQTWGPSLTLHSRSNLAYPCPSLGLYWTCLCCQVNSIPPSADSVSAKWLVHPLGSKWKPQSSFGPCTTVLVVPSHLGCLVAMPDVSRAPACCQYAELDIFPLSKTVTTSFHTLYPHLLVPIFNIKLVGNATPRVSLAFLTYLVL